MLEVAIVDPGAPARHLDRKPVVPHLAPPAWNAISEGDHQQVGLQVVPGRELHRAAGKDVSPPGDRAHQVVPEPLDHDFVGRERRRGHQQDPVEQLVPVAVVGERVEVVDSVARQHQGHGHMLGSRQGGGQLGSGA